MLAHGTGRQPPSQGESAKPDRNIDQENRRPTEMLGQIAAGHRPEGIGANRDGGEIALVARPLARRDRLPDQRLRQRHQPAAAKTLQQTGERQQFDRRRDGAQQRGDDENAERGEHQAAAAEGVAETAVNRRRDGRSN